LRKKPDQTWLKILDRKAELPALAVALGSPHPLLTSLSSRLVELPPEGKSGIAPGKIGLLISNESRARRLFGNGL